MLRLTVRSLLFMGMLSCTEQGPNEDVKGSAAEGEGDAGTVQTAARCGDAVVEGGEECDPGEDGVFTCSEACQHRTLYTRCANGNGITQGSCDDGFICAAEDVCLPKTLSGMAGCPDAPEGRTQTVFGNVCMLVCSRVSDCPPHLTCRVVTAEEREAIPLPGYCVGQWPAS
jgi:hypothetical protein